MATKVSKNSEELLNQIIHEIAEALKDALGQALTEEKLGFEKLRHKIASKKGGQKSHGGKSNIKDPAAIAAAVGRKKLGQKEMTRRSVAGRKAAK